MSHSIAVLTPDPEDEGFHTRWRDVLVETAAALRSAGLEVEGVSWTDGSSLRAFDLVLPLLAWGYHRAGERWRRAVTGWEAEGVRIANPPSVLRWNADKTYLGRFAAQGAPVVPTVYADRLSEALLHETAAAFGTDRLIAKPQVSASAWQTIRWSDGAPLEGGPTGPAMIQPYLPSIETEGEISLIYLEGRFSHAIEKRPRPGISGSSPNMTASSPPTPRKRTRLRRPKRSSPASRKICFMRASTWSAASTERRR